jgi:hypothetical protein
MGSFSAIFEGGLPGGQGRGQTGPGLLSQLESGGWTLGHTQGNLFQEDAYRPYQGKDGRKSLFSAVFEKAGIGDRGIYGRAVLCWQAAGRWLLEHNQGDENQDNENRPYQVKGGDCTGPFSAVFGGGRFDHWKWGDK